MIKTQKPLRAVGVGAQYNCFTSNGPEAVNGYEPEVTKLNTVTSIDTTESRTVTPVYASNMIYDEDVTSQAPALAIANVAFPPRIIARMKGQRVEGGFVIGSTDDVGEYFAHGVVYPKRSGHVRFVWYPHCLLVDANSSAQTATQDSSNAQDQTINIQAYPFNEEGEYKVEYDTELLDVDTTPMTEAEFFAAVLTAPVTTGQGGG